MELPLLTFPLKTKISRLMTEMASMEELQMSGTSVAVAFLGDVLVFFDFWVVFFVGTLDFSVVVSTVVVGVNVGIVGSCVISFKPEIEAKLE